MMRVDEYKCRQTPGIESVLVEVGNALPDRLKPEQWEIYRPDQEATSKQEAEITANGYCYGAIVPKE